MSPDQLSKLIKDKAIQHGFDQVGISKADFLSEEAPKLEQWLKANQHGQMSYMANHFDKRLDPRKLVEGSKSVISLSLNYFPEEELEGNIKIAKYAYGKDYHKIIKKKLKHLVLELQTEIGDFNGRAFVDSAPVMERSWAAKSGLGWIGKNTLLLNKHKGSFFFLAELILDLDLTPDTPVTDHCGSCTACIDACPTDALIAPYELNASQCISYFTIELKEQIPSDVKGKFENWAFGCDICQDVCPWNSKSTPHTTEKLNPNEYLNDLSKTDFQEITQHVFEKVFEGSPIKRTKYEGFARNLNFLKKN